MNEEDWDADISSTPTTASMNYGFNRNDNFSSNSPVDSVKPAAIGRGRGKFNSFDQDFNSFKPRNNYGNDGASNDHNSYQPRNSGGNERGSNGYTYNKPRNKYGNTNGGYSSNKPRSGNCYKCGEEGHISRNCPSGEKGAGYRGNQSNFNGGYGDRNSNSGGGYGGKSSSFGGNSNSGSYGESNFNSDNSYGGKKSFSGGDYGASNSNTNGSFGNSNSYSSGGYGGKSSDSRGNFSDDKSSGGYGGGKSYSGGGYNGSSSPGKYGNENKSYNNDRNGDNRGGGFGSRGGGYKKNNDDGESNGGFESRGGFNQSPGNAGPRKETYIPPPPPENEDEMFESLQRGINFSKYDAIPVEVSGENPPHPISTFEEAQLTETIAKNVARARYETPTPVQKYSIPIVNGGRDLMACAQTGSGKTAAFLLPVLTTLIRTGMQSSTFEKQTPQAIIVGPTRELVNQIYLEARKFARSSICRPCVAYGGTSVGHQMADINRGCNILIATPGRLMDYVSNGRIGLENIQFLILDEADRMLDMGFEGEIRKLATSAGMPPKTERQTLMFSATFPDEIQKLAHDFLKEDFIFLTVGRVGGACTDVSQSILQVDQSDKRAKLLELLVDVSETRSRTLVFVETKRSADFLACSLSQSGYPTTSIHGDRLQREREEALRDFKKGDCPILIATSVAARGLDIPKVEHVINYDLPKEIDEYVHRIGRTGRCGNLGRATSFYDQSKDSQIARCLVRVLADSMQEVPSWLEGCADSAISAVFDSNRSSRFGGRDARTKGRGGGGFDNASSSRATGDYDYNDGGGFDSGPTVYQKTGGGFADDNFGTEECWD